MKQTLLILLLFFSLTSIGQPLMGVISSSQNNVVSSKTYLDVINDTHTVGWYKPQDAANVTAISGVESIWWDMMYGKEGAMEAEQSSGTISTYGVYKITATQANFFYTGCAVGDVFVCATVKTCDANNKVRRFTGNHLTQPTSFNRPTNQVFDGNGDLLHTLSFTLNQPEFIYIVVKQLSWIDGGGFFDGFTTPSGFLSQLTSSPNIGAYAGTWSSVNGGLALNTWGIIRVLFNGASSKLIVNENSPTTWNCGVLNMSGLTVGFRGGGSSSNIQVAEIILRNSADSSEDETILYNYLKTKYGL